MIQSFLILFSRTPRSQLTHLITLPLLNPVADFMTNYKLSMNVTQFIPFHYLVWFDIKWQVYRQPTNSWFPTSSRNLFKVVFWCRRRKKITLVLNTKNDNQHFRNSSLTWYIDSTMSRYTISGLKNEIDRKWIYCKSV